MEQAGGLAARGPHRATEHEVRTQRAHQLAAEATRQLLEGNRTAAHRAAYPTLLSSR